MSAINTHKTVIGFRRALRFMVHLGVFESRYRLVWSAAALPNFLTLESAT